ncbi:transcriptional regulator [Micromonospora sp. DT31]|uniref:transcriptional regulator n=1 Tax=Micromonospora sp. DT31 TaxID=3393434 RepID=UPI003CEE157E
MTRHEDPERIARTRTVTADALFTNRADLRAYPHRLLTVVANGVGLDAVSQAVAAAEFLEAYGWELVTMSEFTSIRLVCAVMRRR